jgi:DNA-3-methyladenine glycosylase
MISLIEAMIKLLKKSFFDRDTLTVARELLGKKLVRNHGGCILSGIVSETEAYIAGDSASHAFRGLTRRNAVMYGPPGTAYVYMIYGMYFMLNVVTEETGTPCAVLIRGLLPVPYSRTAGPGKRTHRNHMAGPGKLCRALSIDLTLNGRDLTIGERLWFEDHEIVPGPCVGAGPRIGIGYAAPADQEAHRRFWIRGRRRGDAETRGHGERGIRRGDAETRRRNLLEMSSIMSRHLDLM